MRKETALCMGCMIEKEHQGDCRHCGYSDDSVYLSSYLAPTTFLADRYIVGKLISYNGEGALYLAFDTKTETKITIKEYMPETLCARKKDEELVTPNPVNIALYKTYLSEFIDLNKSLMSAEKGNLQKVLDVFTLNNTAYVVYEFIVGLSLKNYITNLGGVLTWSQTRKLFTPILETLRTVHHHGILHRGLSCTTILVQEVPYSVTFNNKADENNVLDNYENVINRNNDNDDEQLMLIGFAITAARTYGSDINFEVFSGYAPPELYNTTSRHGNWTDVYGISAVLYKALTGYNPPDAIERMERDNIAHAYVVNNNIPKSVSDILMKGLELDCGKRFQTVDEFMDRLLETPENPLEMGLIQKPSNVSNNRTAAKNRKKKSNTKAIVLMILLALTILAFIAAIVIPAAFPEAFNQTDNGETTQATTAQTEQTTSATTAADTTNHYTEPLYVLPDFKNRPLELIQNSASYSFLIIIPEYEFSNQYADGVIISQNIEPDTDVTFGTELIIKVSKGPKTVRLPDYNGVNHEDYKRQLEALKVNCTLMPEDNSEIPAGEVIRLSVDANSYASVMESEDDPAEPIIIYYSTGSQE